MGVFVKKLINIGGSAISSDVPTIDFDKFVFGANANHDLVSLLQQRNGFYAFESALHIFPAQSTANALGLREWNSPDLWIQEYQGLADGCLFFAEDIFGGQFGIKADGIYIFDPETGAFEFLAENLENWAKAVLTDYEVLTGFQVGHAWQHLNGRLEMGRRLIPKIPFVTGGEFDVENLTSLDSIKAMRLRANLATQIRDLPDGTPIRWNIVN